MAAKKKSRPARRVLTTPAQKNGRRCRERGAKFENEIAERFSMRFMPYEFKRKLGQARDEGNDIDVGCLVVEAKRRQQLKTMRKWMAQAEIAAQDRAKRTPPGQKPTEHIPLVITRENGDQEPLVIMRFDDFQRMTDAYVWNSLL